MIKFRAVRYQFGDVRSIAVDPPSRVEGHVQWWIVDKRCDEKGVTILWATEPTLGGTE